MHTRKPCTPSKFHTRLQGFSHLRVPHPHPCTSSYCTLVSSQTPQPLPPLSTHPQEAHKAEITSLLARAQAQASKTGDAKLTVEHMVLALAENPR